MTPVIAAEVSLFEEEEIRNSPATRRRRAMLGLRLSPFVIWHVELCAQCTQHVRELTDLTGRVIPAEAPAAPRENQCRRFLYWEKGVAAICVKPAGHRGMHEDDHARLFFGFRQE